MSDMRELAGNLRDREIAEQVTGCVGAGDYSLWASIHGYDHVEVLDWTSSAGNWDFLISKDGNEWFVMTQRNNWPRGGFTRSVDREQIFIGDRVQVVEDAIDYFAGGF